jgi:glycosyltransferase involved in cell wall biosynthesis
MEESRSFLERELDAIVVCLSHAWGGLEQVVAQDVMELEQVGLRVRALVLHGSPLDQYLSKHSQVIRITLASPPRDHFDLGMRSRIREWAQEGVNVIHLHQPSLLGSVVPWVMGHPQINVFASRHIMSSHRKFTPYHHWLYRRVDALLVMSQMLRENVLQTHPIEERAVKVVNLGLDFDRFDPDRVDGRKMRTEWGATDDQWVVGLVGRIDPAKGQDTFIRAAASLSRLMDLRQFKFVIVGEETLGRTQGVLEELQDMARELRVEEHVVFAGFHENIPEVMRSFDLLVMPSQQEAFGLVAIEALAMECPIILSRGGSASEIVGQEEFGVLMRPADAFDLAKQIQFLLERPDLREMMGKKGRDHVRRQYDRKVRLFRTLDLYERGIRRRSRLPSRGMFR